MTSYLPFPMIQRQKTFNMELSWSYTMDFWHKKFSCIFVRVRVYMRGILILLCAENSSCRVNARTVQAVGLPATYNLIVESEKIILL